MWSPNSFYDLSCKSKLDALTLNSEFFHSDLLRGEWTKGRTLVSYSSTTSCIKRNGNLLDLASGQIVKGNKRKGFISRYKIGKLEN
jgi:hypothetical protein